MGQYLPIIVSLLSIGFVVYLWQNIKKQPEGEGKMKEISSAIREGAMSYLKRQYKTVFFVAVVIFLILLMGFGFRTAFGFVLGAVLSALSGFVGMIVSTRANSRVAEGAKKGMEPALDLSFKGGLITGLLVVYFDSLSGPVEFSVNLLFSWKNG